MGRTYATLTDVEAVCRSLRAELGRRPLSAALGVDPQPGGVRKTII